MASIQKFEGRRSRGIVWVCDLAKSSKYLNRNDSAEALETFLQRFLFMALVFVEAAGGEFIKWTGDGFLAWFETPLHRNVGDVAAKVFMAAEEMTFWVNITELNVKSPTVKFKIRHAVTFEHDALIIDLAHSGNRSSADVLGRAVVFAFRLSGITAPFPGIVTQGELVKALEQVRKRHFRKLKLTKDEFAKYFKDELWGTKDIYVSERFQPKRNPRHPLRSTLRLARRAIQLESGTSDEVRVKFINQIYMDMRNGPEWALRVIGEVEKFVKNDLFGQLKELIPMLERVQKERAANAKNEEVQIRQKQ